MDVQMRIGRHERPAAKPTLADHIDRAIEQLYEARRVAGDDRRPHRITEQLLDDLDAAGTYLKRIARGG